jgi:hypothetical protein
MTVPESRRMLAAPIMRRRGFLTRVGAASVGLAGLPLAACQTTGLPVLLGRQVRVGYMAGVATDAKVVAELTLFRSRMAQHGWVEGQNLSIVIRYAEGNLDRWGWITTASSENGAAEASRSYASIAVIIASMVSVDVSASPQAAVGTIKDTTRAQMARSAADRLPITTDGPVGSRV